MSQTVQLLPDRIEDEFDIQFSRSSGKGGQHVNKVDTRVEITFDPGNSDLLSEGEKARIKRFLAGQLSRSGQVRVSCQETRSQHTNRSRAIQKMLELLRNAIQPRPRSKGHQERKASTRKRLARKKRKSELKSLRGNIKPHQIADLDR